MQPSPQTMLPPMSIPMSFPSDVTSGSSLTPSHDHPRDVTPDPEHSRPLAMRLSQLVTPEPVQPATQLPSPLRLKPARDHNGLESNCSLPSTMEPSSLPFPPLKIAPVPTPMPMTEPVTPPFSPPVLPPVLPPFSSVTGMPYANSTVNESRMVPASWSNSVNGSPVKSMQSMAQAQAQPQPSGQTGTTSVYSAPNMMPNTYSAMPSTPMYPNNTGTPYYPVDQTTRSTNQSAPKKVMKRPYKKYYSNPTPSSHCHVCARTSKAVKFAVCARIGEGLCRKVTCYKCFMKFGWDWNSAVDNPEWICVHCRGECPEGRSQCYIYSRVNSKRESKRGAKKAAKLAAAAAAAAAAASANVRRAQMMGERLLDVGRGQQVW